VRHLKVTHIYVVAVDENEFELEAIDSIANSGVSMMETHMRGLMPAIEVQSDWQMMPAQYSKEIEASRKDQDVEVGQVHDSTIHLPQATTLIIPEEMLDVEGRIKDFQSDSEVSKRLIERDLDEGITFTRDVLGERGRITHPWDQGLRIFPLDDDKAVYETIALAQKGRLCADTQRGGYSMKTAFCCGLVKGHSGECVPVHRFIGGTDLKELNSGE
jgi:hypothetical protein